MTTTALEYKANEKPYCCKMHRRADQYARLMAWCRPVGTAVFLLFLRAVYGYGFYIAGRGKLGRIPQVTDYFSQLHIPLPGFNAWFVSLLECVGGVMILAGIFTRPIAFMLLVDMIVAYVTADPAALTKLFTDTDTGKFMAADPFWFLAAMFVLVTLGAGWVSVDGVASWLMGRRHEEPRLKRP